MMKKRSEKQKRELNALYAQKREELIKLCYERLQEMLPQCKNEATLLKCIEILEKQSTVVAEESAESFDAIAETLDRLSGKI